MVLLCKSVRSFLRILEQEYSELPKRMHSLCDEIQEVLLVETLTLD